VSGKNGKYPEFNGNVLTMETRQFWRDKSISPKDQDYHYNRNAETYMLVGEALGKGMIQLLGKTN
jgi:alpha-galactosidase